MNANACRTPAEIIDYIVVHHHAYVRRALPRLASYTAEVIHAHGDAHPELYDVADLLGRLAQHMLSHMEKEEQVLFPWIVEASRGGVRPPNVMFGTIVNPIHIMEREHEVAAESVALIRELTDDYEPPADASPAYRHWLAELKAFDEDLRAHVHLEDRILFPAAARLELKANTTPTND
ncbi:MAG: hemerythrin domain-containing protein [Vicinamibacterales bacterium]